MQKLNYLLMEEYQRFLPKVQDRSLKRKEGRTKRKSTDIAGCSFFFVARLTERNVASLVTNSLTSRAHHWAAFGAPWQFRKLWLAQFVVLLLFMFFWLQQQVAAGFSHRCIILREALELMSNTSLLAEMSEMGKLCRFPSPAQKASSPRRRRRLRRCRETGVAEKKTQKSHFASVFFQLPSCVRVPTEQ